jgi:hypothetical protein
MWRVVLALSFGAGTSQFQSIERRREHLPVVGLWLASIRPDTSPLRDFRGVIFF